ncbi:IS3 family transposase [Candidatus Saccharibacteria bacterium]|nr:IS3 family transposase [Candidatus Saccharibacteria bacterium]
MPKHHTRNYIQAIVKKIEDGVSIHEIHDQYAIPQSTIYKWLSKYRKHKTPYGEFTVYKYLLLEKKCTDYKKMLEIVINSPFIQNTPITIRESYMLGLQRKYKYQNYLVCGAFGIHHTTYHHFLYDNKGNNAWFVERKKRLEKLISKIFMESGKSYGASKIRYILNSKYKEKISENYIREIMRDLGLKGSSPKKRKRDTNEAFKRKREKENLIKQNFDATRPNQKWVLDCKMFYCKDRRVEICAIEDLFARRIIAYRLGSKECGRLVCGTLNDTFSVRNPEKGLIIHSDGGATNRSISANRIITRHKAKHSYSRSRNPFDNAAIESFFSRFTAEFIYDAYNMHPFSSIKEMKMRVEKFIHDYNYNRPHGHNDGLPPVTAERMYLIGVRKK